MQHSRIPGVTIKAWCNVVASCLLLAHAYLTHAAPPEALPDPWRAWVEFASYGVLPLEVRCGPGVAVVSECRAVAGSDIHAHSYHDLNTASLEMRPDDAIAQYVLGLGKARPELEAGLPHIIRAVGLTGQPGPLVDLVQNSRWGVTAINRQPAIEPLKKRFVLFEAARRLGHGLIDTSSNRAELARLIGAVQVGVLEADVDALLLEIESVEGAG